MPDLLDDLDRRGLIHDSTDRAALGGRMAAGPITLYYGCDPTAPSLHIGNLIGLVLLRRFQDVGHRPIALAGGATGMIGDPSGRSEERNLLQDDVLSANVAAIKEQMSRVVDLEVPGAALVDNRDWTGGITLLDFLRDIGKHVTVGQMLARESVRARLDSEHGISYTEFSYMLLQAHDYLWLYDHHGCELQIGGSDQWGNILGGIDLVRRTRSKAVHGLCWPLLTASDGTKLGKSTGARVWLDAALTSPYALYQHWMNTPDADLHRSLAQLTLIPMDEIDELVRAHERAPHLREGQRVLAKEVTALVHGPATAEVAAEATAMLFGGDPWNASEAALAVIADEVPGTVLEPGESLRDGVDLPGVLVRCGLAASLGEARRHIDQRGIAVNADKADPARRLTDGDVLKGRWILLRKGKRDWAMVDVRARASDGDPDSRS